MRIRSKTIDIRRLSDLTPDPNNANLGTARGRQALAHSLSELGAGRAVLLDRRGKVIAGNKTVEEAKRLNLPLKVVKTVGDVLVAVQREDLDLLKDPRAQRLAIADNRVGQLDLEWDLDVLKRLHAEGLDLSAFWTAEEFATLFAEPMAGLTDENAVVEPKATDIVRGDLFALGTHRLLCGDATSTRDVARLLDGATPNLALSSCSRHPVAGVESAVTITDRRFGRDSPCDSERRRLRDDVSFPPTPAHHRAIVGCRQRGGRAETGCRPY